MAGRDPAKISRGSSRPAGFAPFRLFFQCLQFGYPVKRPQFEALLRQAFGSTSLPINDTNNDGNLRAQIAEILCGNQDLTPGGHNVLHNDKLPAFDLSTFGRAPAKFDEAELLCKEALEIDKKLFGEESAEVACGLNNIGGMFLDQKKSSHWADVYTSNVRVSYVLKK